MKAVKAFGLVLVPVLAWAGKAVAPAPILAVEHRNTTGSFTFRTPEGWTVETLLKSPETIEARGTENLRVRFVHRPQEVGYDSLHADCMLERLASEMETEPRIEYEYDFVGFEVGPHRALDSAFKIRYSMEIDGHRDWRQRNLTVVGRGESLCVVTYSPSVLWKKSPAARALLDGVVRSVEFR
jgi:hypothetical protein